jgi:hypothetical protein
MKLARLVPETRALRVSASSARRPQSAFTVVQAFETIEEVSARIYGDAKLADSLWQANRDTLPERNTPLSTGMLLRTPGIR